VYDIYIYVYIYNSILAINLWLAQIALENIHAFEEILKYYKFQLKEVNVTDSGLTPIG
jgi:hypothetical protein